MAIKINPDEMRGIASQFGSAMQELNALIGKMQGYTNTLVEGWEGEAAVGYQNRFNTIKDNFTNQMVPLVDEIVQNLNNIANEMENFDKDIGSKFGG